MELMLYSRSLPGNIFSVQLSFSRNNNNNNNNNHHHFILHNTENIIQHKNTLNLNKQKNYSK